MINVIKKVLYILNDDLYISVQGDSIVLKQKDSDEEKSRLPLNAIEQIIIFGNTTISNHLIKRCSDVGIILTYIDSYGNILGRFYGRTQGNVFLRKRQYSLYENDEASLNLCKNIILAKILNSINLLKYYSRFSKDEDVSKMLYSNATKILEQCKQIKDVKDIDQLRGIEGALSTQYFANFDTLLKTKDSNMRFEVRSKRPPLNNCNALLSYLYTLYTLNVTGALETFGLDSQLGYMHRMRSGRASLSCDIIEEFRSPIIDKFVIKLINLSQINSGDFEKTEEGIRLKDNSRKKLLKLWEEHKEEEIYYPFLKKNVKIKILPYLQAQLLSQFIRGDIEDYPPFLYKLN